MATVHRRRQAVVLVAMAALTLAVALLRPAAGSVPAMPGARPDAQAVVVLGPGETVWDLVLPHAPAGADAQAWVAEVVAHNGIDARKVAPGTAVRLPVP